MDSACITRRAAAIFLASWFVWFARDGLSASFAPDDMMNLSGYWEPGVWRSLLSNFTLGTNAYRPMGAVFYLPLYAVFGLNPLPFRIVIFLLLAANVYLAYRLARRLGCGELAAALTALLLCYHPGLADLHYSTATVYDVLCFFFYCAALLYYLRLRADGRSLRLREWAAFLTLYLCALQSKEMAVTLPVAMLAYECLYPRQRRWAPTLAAGALTAIYIAGKIFGADPLMAQEAYRPVLTLHRYLESSTLHLDSLLYDGRFFTPRRALLLWVALALLAWRLRRVEVRFACLWIVFSPLPVVFLVGRTHSALYLPLLGWALLAGSIFAALVDALPRPRAWLRPAVVALAVILLARATVVHKRRGMPAYARHGALTARVLAQFHAANPRVPRGSWVLVVDDPFTDWDAKFITQLWFHDRTVAVWVQNKLHFPEAEIREKMHVILRFEEDHLVKYDSAGFLAAR